LAKKAVSSANKNIDGDFSSSDESKDITLTTTGPDTDDDDEGLVTKTLDDPNNCTSECREKYEKNVEKVTLVPMMRLTADILNLTMDSKPEDEATLNKTIEALSIQYLEPIYNQLCELSKTAAACVEKCPASKLRDIVRIDIDAGPTVCEHKKWSSFSEYWKAQTCIEELDANDDSCDEKCGIDILSQNVTYVNFFVDDDSGEAKIKYQPDAKKNAATIADSCKNMVCQINCGKPIIKEKCGAKAADLAVRVAKFEDEQTLRMLKVMEAVDPNTKC